MFSFLVRKNVGYFVKYRVGPLPGTGGKDTKRCHGVMGISCLALHRPIMATVNLSSRAWVWGISFSNGI